MSGAEVEVTIFQAAVVLYGVGYYIFMKYIYLTVSRAVAALEAFIPPENVAHAACIRLLHCYNKFQQKYEKRRICVWEKADLKKYPCEKGRSE